ncbi:MAG: hypothetical protein GY834_08990 [Bacteroidetes bacterium]|nr:hypothetical protein [Bacteroidota bacterium]
MKLIRIYFIFTAIIVLFGCQTYNVKQQPSLPAAPSGFDWITSTNGIGSFIKPNEWFLKEEKSGDTNALFITKENIATEGKFITGLSVNQINYFSKTQSVKPSQYAKAYAAKIAASDEVLKNGVVKGDFPDMNIMRIKGINNGVPTIVHHISIGMDAKDQLYLLIFEAPESEWEHETKHSSPMLNFFILGE